MKLLLPVTILSLLFLNASAGTGADGQAAPTPLERAADPAGSIKPDRTHPAFSTSQTEQERSRKHAATARELIGSGRLYESIEHYRLAFIYADDPSEKEQLLFERADAYTRMNYHTEASVCLDVLLKTFPESSRAGEAHLAIAEARYRLGDYREALAHFEKADGSLRARYGRANTLQNLGRTAEAHALYQELLEKDAAVINSSPETLYFMGENFRLSGSPGNARVYYASVKDPAFRFKASLGLGLLAKEERSFEQAAGHFQDAEQSPDRIVKQQAGLNRAEALIQLGRYDEAETALSAIRKNYPYGSAYDNAALLLSRLYKTRGEYEQSIGLLKELIYRRTPSAEALDQLEAVMLEAAAGKQEELLRLWKIGGRWLLDQTRSLALTRIARGLRHSGRPFVEICSWLVKNGDSEAKSAGRLLLADFYAGLGETAMALSFLERSGADNGSDEVLRIRARIALAGNEPARAAETVLALRNPDSSDFLLLLDALRAAPDPDRLRSAAAVREKLPPATPEGAVLWTGLADLLLSAGMRPDALRCYRAAASSTHPDAAGDRAWALHRIAALSAEEERISSLEALQRDKTPVGRFAGAELRSVALGRKVE